MQTPAVNNRDGLDAGEYVNEIMLAENEIWADFDKIVKNYGSYFKIAHINAHGYSMAGWIYLLFLRVKSTLAFPIACSMSKVFVCVVAIERPKVEG